MQNATYIEKLYLSGCRLFFGSTEPAVVKGVRELTDSPSQLFFLFLERAMEAGGTFPNLTTSTDDVMIEAAFQLILQRAPESQQVQIGWHKIAPTAGQLIMGLLDSQEFKQRTHELVAQAFPSSPKLWHVHIPKTAGSALIESYRTLGRGIVNASLIMERPLPFADVARDLTLTRLRRGILFTGHIELERYRHLIQSKDTALCFVRHPIDRVVSFFNYLKTLSDIDPNRVRSDIRMFLQNGFNPSSFSDTYDDGRIFGMNSQCEYLSAEKTAGSAIRSARRSSIVLAPTRHATAVMTGILGCPPLRGINTSQSHIRPGELPETMKAKILHDNSEDMTLFKHADVERDHDVNLPYLFTRQRVTR